MPFFMTLFYEFTHELQPATDVNFYCLGKRLSQQVLMLYNFWPYKYVLLIQVYFSFCYYMESEMQMICQDRLPICRTE